MKRFLLGVVVILSSFVHAHSIIDVLNTYVRDVMTTELTELECLALNIYHEARGESLLGRKLVAQVTVNRVRHNGFPDTVCGVVRQSKQFSWTHDGRIDHPRDRAAYEEAYLISIAFLLLNQKADVHYYNLLLNYHALSINPAWSNLQPVLVHGEHVFLVRKRELVEK